jgi:hypothetical protein
MSKIIRSTKFWLDGKGLILRPSHSGDEAAIARLLELGGVRWQRRRRGWRGGW